MSRLGMSAMIFNHHENMCDLFKAIEKFNKKDIGNQNNKRFDSYQPSYNGKVIKQYSCRLKRDNILRK